MLTIVQVARCAFRPARRARLARAVALSSSLLCSLALAHGDWPAQHGGIMNEGGETSFELIQKGQATTVCLSDHGKPVATRGANGTLQVTRAGKETRHDLKAVADGNCLAASGAVVKLRAGDTAMTRVQQADGSVVIGRFAVR
jgi:hypothetical protein